MPLQIVRQDITKMKVDVIVNSADAKPIVGGGVDLVIHKAGGQALVDARKKLGDIQTSEVMFTKAYNLPSKYVIHTVGPIYSNYDKTQDQALYACYKKSLILSQTLNCHSIAFPLISSGVYGYPKDQALSIASKAIKDFLKTNEMMIYLVIFDKESYILSKNKHQDIKSYIDEFAIQQQEQEEWDYLVNNKSLTLMKQSISPSIDFENIDDTWQESLLKLIKRTGKKNSDIYKKANITKQHFSKIYNDPDYHPGKATAIAFCIALKLDLQETIDLIEKAGYHLSKSIKFDLIVRYYIERNNYDIFEINEVLFDFDQELLGSYSI